MSNCKIRIAKIVKIDINRMLVWKKKSTVYQLDTCSFENKKCKGRNGSP